MPSYHQACLQCLAGTVFYVDTAMIRSSFSIAKHVTGSITFNPREKFPVTKAVEQFETFLPCGCSRTTYVGNVCNPIALALKQSLYTQGYHRKLNPYIKVLTFKLEASDMEATLLIFS